MADEMSVDMGTLQAAPTNCFDQLKMGFDAHGHGGWGIVWHLLMFQDWNAGSGADGWHWENHDAEWQYPWHIQGHWNGHKMLMRAVFACYTSSSISTPVQ